MSRELVNRTNAVAVGAGVVVMVGMATTTGVTGGLTFGIMTGLTTFVALHPERFSGDVSERLHKRVLVAGVSLTVFAALLLVFLSVA